MMSTEINHRHYSDQTKSGFLKDNYGDAQKLIQKIKQLMTLRKKL